MISGINFYKECKWNFCNRYKMLFDEKLYKEGDFIFLNLDFIQNFINFTKSKNIKGINLVTHNSDLSFNKDMLHYLRDNVNHIFCINGTISDEKVTKIPLGFSDRLLPVISKIEQPLNKLNNLYLNFGGRDRYDIRRERVECYNYYKNFDWIKIEDNIPEIEYYNSLKNSKYALCPIGQGLDTHRFYESLYFGTIPIVKRNDLSDLHQQFPCIIVDNWEEISLEFLELNYDKYNISLTNWSSNTNWLDCKFWIK